MSHLVGNIGYCIPGIRYMTKYALPVGVYCRPVSITRESSHSHSQIVDALLDGGETCTGRETIILPHIIIHHWKITGKEPVSRTEIQRKSRSPMCMDPLNKSIDVEIKKVVEKFVSHHLTIDCKFTRSIPVHEVFPKGSMTEKYVGCLTTIN